MTGVTSSRDAATTTCAIASAKTSPGTSPPVVSTGGSVALAFEPAGLVCVFEAELPPPEQPARASDH